MPLITLITNVQVEDSKGLNLELSKFSSETLGMPHIIISVNVVQSDSLSFAGSFDPAFFLKVESLGDNISPEANVKYTEAYSTFLKDKLSIPNDRGFIFFVDVGKTNIGFKGTTVAVLQEALAKVTEAQGDRSETLIQNRILSR
ncbi:Tautomerase/MIF superfamily [Crepidotus variabilis]|uniref:L-dopachrome isomerase n=1 Tax=Crepidotus variabilis TaxID=179855 RepID=A0A9P6E3S3_9AGAR|nr:Tautomerase/MIF superfamily [Crepidotus variabilis]